MAVELNHTIVASRDKRAAARHLADLLGLREPVPFGPFHVLTLANGVSMDFADTDTSQPTHYAFLVTDDEFDQIFARITAQGLPYFANPRFPHRHGKINTRDGGRGLYFKNIDGHTMEIITRPYGGTPRPAD